MFDIAESQELYLQAMLEKSQKLVDEINGYPFVKSAELVGQQIKIDFYDEVDLEGQDILDLFIRGGAIKKVNSKDNDDNFILVEPIGEF